MKEVHEKGLTEKTLVTRRQWDSAPPLARAKAFSERSGDS